MAHLTAGSHLSSGIRRLSTMEKSARRSPNSEATFLFTELVKKNISSLVFARSRKLTELIYVYSRDHLPPASGR